MRSRCVALTSSAKPALARLCVQNALLCVNDIIDFSGEPCRIRTCDPLIKSQIFLCFTILSFPVTRSSQITYLFINI